MSTLNFAAHALTLAALVALAVDCYAYRGANKTLRAQLMNANGLAHLRQHQADRMYEQRCYYRRQAAGVKASRSLLVAALDHAKKENNNLREEVTLLQRANTAFQYAQSEWHDDRDAIQRDKARLRAHLADALTELAGALEESAALSERLSNVRGDRNRLLDSIDRHGL